MDPALLTPLARQMLDDLPPFLRTDPTYQAVQYAFAQEVERFEARLDALLVEFFPKTADSLLKVFEAQLGLPVEPAAKTLEERRSLVLVRYATIGGDPSGRTWVRDVTDLIGPGWAYEEHNPDIPGSPPAGFIRVTLPFGPESDRYAEVRNLILDTLPAGKDLIISSVAGFVLDHSQLDEETFES